MMPEQNEKRREGNLTEEIIQWGKLTPEERNVLIHTKVMGNAPYVPCPGTVVNTKQPYTNPAGYSDWYIWKCDTCREEFIFHKENYPLRPRLPHKDYFAEKPEIPHYSESMDAAWEIMEHASENMLPAYPDMSSYWTYKAFLYALWRDENITEWTDIDLYNPYALNLEFDQIVALSPKRICIAALRAVGCIVVEVPRPTPDEP